MKSGGIHCDVLGYNFMSHNEVLKVLNCFICKGTEQWGSDSLILNLASSAIKYLAIFLTFS